MDTPFDLKPTRGMRDSESVAARILDRLVNTYADADHCNGHGLVAGAEAIASRAAAEKMAAQSPERPAMPMPGACHTPGGIPGQAPDDRNVFNGDIPFIEGHSIVWAGPVANWVAACNHLP